MTNPGGVSGGPLDKSGPIEPTGPVTSGESVSGGSATQDKRYWNTLSKSDQEDVMQVLLANAYQPILPTPSLDAGNVDVSISGIISSVEAKFAQIGSEIWKGYIQNLQAISDQVAEMIKSPQYQLKIQETEPTSIQRVLDNNYNLVSGMSDYVNTHTHDKDAIPFIAMSMIVAGGVILNSISVVNAASASIVGPTPVLDAAQLATQVVQPALAESSAMVINLFLPAMLYTTTFAMERGTNGGKSDKQIDIDFARKFATNILAQVQGNEIKQFLAALIVNKFNEGEPISKEQMAQAQNITKLIMLSVAFALFYKVETKWLTGQEFADFIKNNPYKQGTEEFTLIETIKQYLAMIPPDDRSTILEGLMAYCDKNPNIEELLNPEKAFSKIINGFNREVDAA